MEDIRLKSYKWSFAGRDWELTCNMNVIADVQGLHGGDLFDALSSPSTMGMTLEFLAAMMNDYADSRGWQVRYEAKELGRIIGFNEFNDISLVVMDLVRRAISPEEPESQEADEAAESDASKN